jgi:hypothetical protein
MKITTNIRSLLLIPFLIFFFSFSGCGSLEPQDAKITLSFSGGTIIDKIQEDTLKLDMVKILLREIRIRSQSTDDTMNVRADPFVAHLDLSGITTDFTVANIPPGNYDRIKFKVHKIGGSETSPDPEFKEGTDESLRYSIIIKGSVNSNPFVYKSRKSAHQDLKLETPINVEENGVVNLTIIVNPFSWFTDGANILDPTDPVNENNIDNNIKESFKKAFQDNNHDGIID